MDITPTGNSSQPPPSPAGNLFPEPRTSNPEPSSAALRISVVIPTRHRNDLLALCLDRLRPGVQTLAADAYEVIVTDDGSTSSAQTMIEQSYPWARWTAGPRRGPAANRNHGASLARGEWIAFTDDDCLPDPQWLAAYAAVMTDGVHVYEGKTTCQAGVKTAMEQAPVNLTGGWLWSCNMMVRRSFFIAHPFDEEFPMPHMEDVFFREQLRLAGEKFLWTPGAVVDHPPRRLPSGAKWAASHECDIIYRYRSGLPAEPLLKHLITLAKFRIKKILGFPLGKDTLIATYSFGEEVVCVVMKYGGWKKKNAGKFKAKAM